MSDRYYCTYCDLNRNEKDCPQRCLSAFDKWFTLWDQTHDQEIRRLCEISWNAAFGAAAKPAYGPGTQDEIKHLSRQIDELLHHEALVADALQGILEIGKRDMSNPKYDGYFQFAKDALANWKAGRR